jgi:hypothetical protein
VSAPGRLGGHARAARLQIVRPWEAEPSGRSGGKAPLVIPKPYLGARCPRCGMEKAWLRPGEMCAPCLAARGAPPARAVDDEQEPAASSPPVVVAAHEPLGRRRSGVVRLEPQEADVAEPRTTTCEDCEREFQCSPYGKLPKRCPKCKEKPADDAGDEEDEAGEEGGTAAADLDLAAVGALATAAGLDPVELLLEAILAAHRAGRGS